jgi:hypothetical protein
VHEAFQITIKKLAPILVVAALLGLDCKAGETSSSKESYALSVHSRQLSDERVLIEITTNIPGTIELMAGLELVGQAPDDIFIGTHERVKVTNGAGKVIFDVSTLPSGEYEATAGFYPRWGFKDDESRATGITESLADAQLLSLRGSGEPASALIERNKGQNWVMDNAVPIGKAWEPSKWVNRLGMWKEIPVTTRNPRIIKNYYFESVDMTVVVNTLKNEIVTWRMGQEGL